MDTAMGDVAVEQGAQEVAAPVIMEEAVNSIEEATERVLKEAMAVNGLRIGCNQVVKAIESQEAHVVFLASNVEEKKIAQAITLLAAERKVAVVEVPDSKELGKWAGLCKLDSEGQARKIVGASSVAICEFGADSPAYGYLMKHIKSSN